LRTSCWAGAFVGVRVIEAGGPSKGCAERGSPVSGFGGRRFSVGAARVASTRK
jgi:hypothetical protein